MRPFIDGVIARGYRTLLNGMSGGMLWGVGRQAMMQLANVSKDKGDAAGLKHWQDLKVRWLEYERTGFPPNATGLQLVHGTKVRLWYDPLAELVDLMAGATYAELNRPRAKSLAVKAFPPSPRRRCCMAACRSWPACARTDPWPIPRRPPFDELRGRLWSQIIKSPPSNRHRELPDRRPKGLPHAS